MTAHDLLTRAAAKVRADDIPHAEKIADWLDKTAAVCREAAGTPLEIVANGLAEPALALARSILEED